MMNSGGSVILITASRGMLLLGVKMSSSSVSTPALASASVATHVAILGTIEKVPLHPVALASPRKASMAPSAASREASPTLAVTCA